jgi:hypothetical protein
MHITAPSISAKFIALLHYSYDSMLQGVDYYFKLRYYCFYDMTAIF